MKKPKFFPILHWAALLLLITGCNKAGEANAETQNPENALSVEERIRKDNRKVRSALFDRKPLKVSNQTTSMIRYVRYNVHSEPGIPPNRIFDTLSVSKRTEVYADAMVFIQRLSNFSDTLEVYQDSVRYNSFGTKALGERIYSFKGKPIRIRKHLYSGRSSEGRMVVNNIFINDSLGLILNYGAGSHSMVLGEYNPQFNEIHEAIKRDTVFLEFEME